MSNPYSNDPNRYYDEHPTRAYSADPRYSAGDPPLFDLKRFVGGVAATALTTFLAGTIAEAIIQAIYKRTSAPVVWMYGVEDPWIAGVYGAIAALLAGGLLFLLFQGVPSPGTFFAWIAGLITVAVIVLPFFAAPSIGAGLGAAIVNGLMGIVIVTLLSTTSARTYRGQIR